MQLPQQSPLVRSRLARSCSLHAATLNPNSQPYCLLLAPHTSLSRPSLPLPPMQSVWAMAFLYFAGMNTSAIMCHCLLPNGQLRVVFGALDVAFTGRHNHRSCCLYFLHSCSRTTCHSKDSSACNTRTGFCRVAHHLPCPGTSAQTHAQGMHFKPAHLLLTQLPPRAAPPCTVSNPRLLICMPSLGVPGRPASAIQ